MTNNNSMIHPVVSPSERTLPTVQLTGICDRYILSNGVEIPCLGFGTYMLPNDEKGAAALKSALDAGIRHIDTAATYQNKDMVGRVIAESDIPRNELFITSKLQNKDQGYESTLTAFERSCSQLQTDYLDLYLIHWPRVSGREDDWEEQTTETWRAFEELYDAHRIRAIGVSNFLMHHLERFVKNVNIFPMVDQVEFNPTYQQRETVEWCQDHGIQLEAWAPLGRGSLFNNQSIINLSHDMNREIGQICIRYALQNGFVVMPKSTNPAHIISNCRVFDFELDAGEMATLHGLDTNDGYTLHPDKLDEWPRSLDRMYKEAGVSR